MVAIRSRPWVLAVGAVCYLLGLEIGLAGPYGNALSHELDLHHSSWIVWFVIHVIAAAAFVLLGVVIRFVGTLGRFAQRSQRSAEYERQLLVDATRAGERNRIAREMHDVIAHRVSLIALHAGSLELQTTDAKVAESAGIIRESARAALDELRGVLTVLREEPARDELAPQPGLADLNHLVDESRRAGVAVRYLNQLDSCPAGPVERTAYRIVQEALTNVHKHAPASEVVVDLSGAPNQGLHVRISNSLSQRAPSPDDPGNGRGLVGIAERVSVLGGQVSYGETSDHRRLIDAELPWPTEKKNGNAAAATMKRRIK